MKLCHNKGVTVVTLSRRNLLTLTYKLSQPTSQRTLVKSTPDGMLVVKAEDDDTHYKGATPGPVAPDAEVYIKQQWGDKS